jgi:HNH endonuclease
MWEHTSIMSKNYRKIYEKYYQCSLLSGIDIHHIDGNHNNNDPMNLQAVTLSEHYEIHKSLGDLYAAYLIGRRMKIKPEDWTILAKINGHKSGKLNWENGIGLVEWIKNNPEQRQEMSKLAGKKLGDLMLKEQQGIFAASPEQRQEWSSLGGKKSAELGFGFKAGHASSAGKIGGINGGKYAKENKTGIHNISEEAEYRRQLNSKTTKAVNAGKASYISGEK